MRPESYPFREALRLRLRRNLAGFPRRVRPDGARRAAVALVVLPDEDADAALVLTQRAHHLPRHGGQYALPGGRIDAEELAEDAARRELAEEVGVELREGSALGRLDDYSTRSGWVVTPVVFWGEENVVELVPDPGEVAGVYRVRLEDLVRPEIKVERRLRGHEGSLLSLRLLGTEIFCPTAAMVYQFLEVGLRGRHTRVEGFEQPHFAWR